MSKLLILLLFLTVSFFMLSGCHTEYILEPNLETEILRNSLQPESPPIATSSRPVPSSYANLDDLLLNVAIVSFHESQGRVRRCIHSAVIAELEELYMPLDVSDDILLESIGIGVLGMNEPILLTYRVPHYSNFRTITANFNWYRNKPTDEVFFTELYAEGAVVPSRFHWSQHGYEFEAFVPTDLSEDAYSFIDAILNPQPVVAWELQGNAISVTIHGLDNITILDKMNNKIINTRTPRDIYFLNAFSNLYNFLDHHTLYISDGENLTRTGYNWIVTTGTSRRQFVLQPGIYTFQVDEIIGEPQLLIRHFYNREIVSSVDFTEYLAGQDFTSFTITVTADNSGSGDVVVTDTSAD